MNNYEGLEKEAPEILEAFNKWKPRIYAWARKLSLQNEFDLDELMQESMHEIMWAKSTFESGKGVAFTSWAYRALSQYFLNKLKGRYALKSGENKIHLNLDDVYDWPQFLPTRKLGCMEGEIINEEDFKRLVESLSPHAKVIISVLLQQDNDYSHPFWMSFYTFRDKLIIEVSKDSKKRLRLDVMKFLKKELKISDLEMDICCEEIARSVGRLDSHDLGRMGK